MTKITDVRPFTVFNGRRNCLFVVVETADGLSGVGESGLSGHEQAVSGAVERYRKVLIGEDARRVEHIWQVMSRGGFFPAQRVLSSAIAAIDLALWDLRGKRLDVPVYELLGGKVRDHIPAYTGIAGEVDLLEAVHDKIADGWKTVRFGVPGGKGVIDSGKAVQTTINQFAAIRGNIGDDVDLIVDAHTRLRPQEAIRLCRELEPYRPYFVEDPLRCENLDSYRQLRARTGVPIAAGEQLSSKWEFKTLIENELIDFARIDLCIAGGLTEATKIAALCETHHVSIAVHNPLGPVSTAACAHFSSAMTMSAIQEQPRLPGSMLADLFPEQPVRYEDGKLHLADTPGLGITVDEAAAANSPARPWTNPNMRRPDGSFTNW